MKKVYYIAVGILGLWTSSCGDDLNVPDNKKYPTQIETENYTTTFAYNNNKQMTKMSRTTQNNQLNDWYISYDNSGKPNKITTIQSEQSNINTQVISVNYNSDTQITLTSDTGETTFVLTDIAGKMISKTTSSGTISYLYDSQGNNIQINKQNYTMSAVYGNTLGIFSAINTPQWVLAFIDNDYHLFHAKNPDSKTEIITNNGVGNTKLTTYQYPTDFLYHGYPTRIISTNNSNGNSNQNLIKITY